MAPFMTAWERTRPLHSNSSAFYTVTSSTDFRLIFRQCLQSPLEGGRIREEILGLTQDDLDSSHLRDHWA